MLGVAAKQNVFTFNSQIYCTNTYAQYTDIYNLIIPMDNL